MQGFPMRMGDKGSRFQVGKEKAPKDLFHLHAMWRYQYLWYAMVPIERKTTKQRFLPFRLL